MMHEHQWVRQGSAAGAYSEALWGTPTCTVCGATLAEPCEHKWRDDYYGLTCVLCGMFVPDGQGPWMPDEA